ncbi:MAG: hypothetical protein V1804_01645 [Patescibacteria group bacterium]
MLTDAQKKQQKQLALLLAVILITIAILLFSRKKSPAGSTVGIIDAEIPSDGIPTLNDTKTENNSDILTGKAFNDLKRNGQYPVAKGEISRDNPFIPYEEEPANE